jgi:hypothetical protein
LKVWGILVLALFVLALWMGRPLSLIPLGLGIWLVLMYIQYTIVKRGINRKEHPKISVPLWLAGLSGSVTNKLDVRTFCIQIFVAIWIIWAFIVAFIDELQPFYAPGLLFIIFFLLPLIFIVLWRIAKKDEVNL